MRCPTRCLTVCVCVCVGHPPVAAIQAEVAPNGMRLGAFATRDITPEEVYLSVPQSLIMDVQSAFK